MAESCTATRPDLDQQVEGQVAGIEKAMAWLADEFPAWDIQLDSTSGWNGGSRDLWVALREGHHPQRELSAAKLHTRLDEYEERERQRRRLAGR